MGSYSYLSKYREHFEEPHTMEASVAEAALSSEHLPAPWRTPDARFLSLQTLTGVQSDTPVPFELPPRKKTVWQLGRSNFCLDCIPEDHPAREEFEKLMLDLKNYTGSNRAKDVQQLEWIALSLLRLKRVIREQYELLANQQMPTPVAHSGARSAVRLAELERLRALETLGRYEWTLKRDLEKITRAPVEKAADDSLQSAYQLDSMVQA